MLESKSERAPESIPLLDSDLLKTFITIAENGSFTRAAQLLFRTPSALSMQIKRLEEMLGTSLFVREARKVRLTPEGEVLLSFGRRLIRLNREAVSRFIQPTVEGTIRFAMSDDIGTRILPGVLAQFANRYPAVQVDVTVGRSLDLTARLERGEFDLLLVTAYPQLLERGHGRIVHSEPLVWAGLKEGFAVRRHPLPLALAEPGCCWRAMALACLDEAGREYRIAYTSASSIGLESALMADLAIASLPRTLVKPPLCIIDAQEGLPPLGEYQLLLIQGENRGTAGDAIAQYITQALQAI